MPLAGSIEPPPHEALYFKSLKELDEWTPGSGSAYDGVAKYKSRNDGEKGRGRLLVCHDYKGGYTESSFARSYTYNWWSSCDTFIYFSHHRVTVPPPGWITAAHRQGVKMLGTLIFEGGGEEDCLRLLVGKFPTSRTGQVTPEGASSSFTLPLSPHYARVLAELAGDRGFDGYLLNFECPLGGALEQTRALAAWITILQREIVEKVGAWGEVLWYDSVVINGQLAWQDRLNSYNLPFFLSSSGIFTNYTWRNDYPVQTAQYFLSLEESLSQPPAPAPSSSTSSSAQTKWATPLSTKTLQDIYIGIDVWGRGSHGGGGFGAYKALQHISPSSLGLSAAIFGQAWSWESEQDKPGFSWDSWWMFERTLWAGAKDEEERRGLEGRVPEVKWKRGEEVCVHGDFEPIGGFFEQRPPPVPEEMPFHTSFSTGTGVGWFVEGRSVFSSESASKDKDRDGRGAGGWTDVDKQTGVGDLLWPVPRVYWEDARPDPLLPTATSEFEFNEAWTGGNSLAIAIKCPGSEEETAAYRALWVPVQRVAVTAARTYRASVVYKLKGELAEGVDVEIALSLHSLGGPLSESDNEVGLDVVSSESEELVVGGWTRLTIEFCTGPSKSASPVSGDDLASPPPRTLALGMVVAVVSETPDQPLEVGLLLGQMNVHPRLPDSFTEDEALILWADYSPAVNATSTTTTMTTSVTAATVGAGGSIDIAASSSKLAMETSTATADSSSTSASSGTGTLTWEVTSTFPAVRTVPLTSPDDPVSAWNVQPFGVGWFPEFLYFNIYAQAFFGSTSSTAAATVGGGGGEATVGGVDQAKWIGTSGAGWSGRKRAFEVVERNLWEVLFGSEDEKGEVGGMRGKKVRFYIQGVADRGEVMKWERCAYVDVQF